MGMLFSWSVGSNGSGPDRFVLYVPFTVSLGCEISSIDREMEHNIEGYKIGLEKLTNFYAITVGEFNSIDEAHRFFPKLCSSFLWASLKLKAGISYPKLITEINLEDNPVQISKDSNFRMVTDLVGWNEVDGYYDADKAVMRPEGKKLIKIETGRPTVVIGVNAEDFVKFISEAISFESPENIVNDKKLKLAINLYSTSHYEVSDNAKFITIVNVLEALKKQEEISNVSKEVLKSAKSHIKEKRDLYDKHSEEWKELENLISQVGQLKRQSVKKSIKKFISETIGENPELGDQKTISKKVGDVYDIRSNLLHDGTADCEKIKKELHFLKEFIPKLLEYLYRKEASHNCLP